jgi:hypothetical protein
MLLSLLLVAGLLLVVGCSSTADEQATADYLASEAAVQAAQDDLSTREADMLTTVQAAEAAIAALETANIEAGEQAMVQATADSEAAAAANEQATIDAQAIVSAEVTASAIETAMAQATSEAEMLATVSYEATQQAFKSEQLSMIRGAQFETPVVDIEEGSLVHDTDEDPEIQATDVDLHNFVAQTDFAFEHGDADIDSCDFGLGFRSSDEGASYLLLNEQGSWQLLRNEEGDEEVVQEGQTDALLDGWNELALYIDEEDGFFSVNGEYVAALDLEQSNGSGDIVLVTGMGEDAEAEGASLQYKRLQVWSMDPIPPTPTPAPAATASGPQAPGPTGGAHTFPETPIKPFDRDEFVSYVGQLRDSLRSYTSEMDLMRTTRKPGDCGTFRGWLSLWIQRSPGYTDVPASFASLYREYRSLLSQVVNLSQEIRTVCDAGGGLVSDETIDSINEFLSWAYPRSEQMVVEASALPAP